MKAILTAATAALLCALLVGCGTRPANMVGADSSKADDGGDRTAEALKAWGESREAAETTGAVGWNYAGLAALEIARDKAARTGRLVLVGLKKLGLLPNLR